MMRILFFAVVLAFLNCFSAFSLVSIRNNGNCLSRLQMAREKPPSVGNLARKLKRKLRTVDATSFETIYTPEFDAYLKGEATGRLYSTIIDALKKKARQVGVSLKSDFGIKPVVVLPNIVETAVAAGSFTTLLKAVEAAGLVDVLKGGSLKEGGLTVFAPSDEAFAKVAPETLEGLLADKEKLEAVLKFHVVAGNLKAKKLATMKDAPPATVNGAPLAIKVSRDGEVTLPSNAKVVSKDIKCSNGFIHVIDTVMMP